MEYSKVKPIPHDPAMDPDETIPSYATSTGVMEREVATGQSMEEESDSSRIVQPKHTDSSR